MENNDQKSNNIFQPKPLTIDPSLNQSSPNTNPTKSTDENTSVPNWVAPINRTGMAIAAGYLGMFAILILPAPIALLFGILAILGLKKNPEKIGKSRAWFGIIMGIFGTIVLVLIIIGGLTHKK